MEMLNIKINGKDYQVEKNTTILEACHKFGIKIPTLCFLKEINEIGAAAWLQPAYIPSTERAPKSSPIRPRFRNTEK